MLKAYSRVQARLNSLRSDEAGNAAEYGLIIGIVAVGIIIALGLLAAGLSGLFTDVGSKLNNIPVS
ncbi:Flp family type IVb pilin [Agromyces bauzanensis]